jgi:hypothetical protein
LQGSLAWQEVWLKLVARADALNLCRVQLDVNAPSINEGYHARWARGGESTEDSSLWRAEIPLTVQGKAIGRMVVAGVHDESPFGDKLTALAILLQECETVAFDLMKEAVSLSPRMHPTRRLVGRPESIPAG